MRKRVGRRLTTGPVVALHVQEEVLPGERSATAREASRELVLGPRARRAVGAVRALAEEHGWRHVELHWDLRRGGRRRLRPVAAGVMAAAATIATTRMARSVRVLMVIP